MDHAKAQLLANETACINATENCIYGNKPFDISMLDCISANRPLPCNRCIAHSPKALEFPSSPLPPGCLPLVPFAPAAVSSSTPPASKLCSKTLMKKERDAAQTKLVAFGETVRLAEHGLGHHGYWPRASFFSLPTILLILNMLLADITAVTLQAAIPKWPYFNKYGDRLLELALQLRDDIKTACTYVLLLQNANAQATRAANKVITPATSSKPFAAPTSSLIRRK
jgi:hypothetical protein